MCVRLMTACKVALTNLIMKTRDQYFLTDEAHTTRARLAPCFRLPGRVARDSAARRSAANTYQRSSSYDLLQPLRPQLRHSIGESIAMTAHGFDIARLCRIGFDFAAQPTNMHVNRARVTLEVITPHVLQ
jgi:hypothetical protein